MRSVPAAWQIDLIAVLRFAIPDLCAAQYELLYLSVRSGHRLPLKFFRIDHDAMLVFGTRRDVHPIGSLALVLTFSI